MASTLIFGGGGIAEGIKQIIKDAVILPKEEVDVTRYSQVESALDRYRPDTVINCAGVSYVSSVKESNLTDWHQEINVNLLGSYHVAKAACEYGVGKMIFIASVAGKYGKPEHSGYCASKAGVISLVQSLGMEGYDAYAISPGRVDTKMREQDYPGENLQTRLRPTEVGLLVQDIIGGVFRRGDNIVIRRIGYETQPFQVDKGEPWLSELRVGQPVTV